MSMKPVEQFQPTQIIRQQQVLAHLGYYKGRIDGIWGPKCIAAKKEFESMGFAPGLPNGGLPFAARGPYPKGVMMIGGLLTCAGFDETKHPVYDPNRTRPANKVQKPEVTEDKEKTPEPQKDPAAE